ncbi:MAG: hypothetical protein V4674_00685 [Patescibacteria group bacterium]
MRLIVTITLELPCDKNAPILTDRKLLEKAVRDQVRGGAGSIRTTLLPSWGGEEPPDQYEGKAVLKCIQLRSTALGMHKQGRGFIIPTGTSLECGGKDCDVEHRKNLPEGTLLWGPSGFQPPREEDWEGWLPSK